jgi:uncharacterized membrane protein YfcA
MNWDIGVFLLVTLIISSGSLLQAATGMGAGFIVIPLLSLISLDLVPAPAIFASMTLSTTMTVKGYKHIDRKGLGILLLGIFVGILLGAYLLSQMPVDRLGVVFGGLILLIVLLSVCIPKFTLTVPRILSAGCLSGIVGTIVGFGAPILALLYQHHRVAVIRATLAFLYLVSSVAMLTALYFTGRFGPGEVVSGLYLIPGFILGYLVSPRLAAYVNKGRARSLMLIISTLSAICLILKSV